MSDSLQQPKMLLSAMYDQPALVTSQTVCLSFTKPVIALGNINLGLTGVTLVSQAQVSHCCIMQKYSGNVSGKSWSASPSTAVLTDLAGNAVASNSGTFSIVYDPPFNGAMTFIQNNGLIVFCPQSTYLANGLANGYSGGVFNLGAVYIEDPASDAAMSQAISWDNNIPPAVTWPPPWDQVTGPAWMTSTAYTQYVLGVTNASVVTQGGQVYYCLISHTSGVFMTDLAAGKWALVAQFTDDPGLGYKQDIIVTPGPLEWAYSVCIVEFPLTVGGSSLGSYAPLANQMPTGSSQWKNVNNQNILGGGSIGPFPVGTKAVGPFPLQTGALGPYPIH